MAHRRILRLYVFLYALSLSFSLHANSDKTPLARGYGGAVATINELASKAALKVLNEGGNAIDASVAAAAVLGVTDPFSCGIGGGGFMMIYLAKDKRVISIDHRETAPAAIDSSLFQQQGKDIDFEKAKASGLSIGVPGTVRGWHEALTRFGTKDFATLLAPAIEIAERGFAIDANFHRINKINEKKFALFTSSRDLYLKNNQALALGSHFKNPDLARAYREISSHGVRYFYEDKPAKAIVASVQHPPTVKGQSVRGGSMSMADLANYETRLRLPIQSTYRGYAIYGMNLPSSGGISIALALNILEGFDLSSMPREKVEHLYLETSRLVFADRNAYLADPEFVEVPIKGLLSKEYAAIRRKLISESKANNKIVSAGDPSFFMGEQKSRIKMGPLAMASFSEESSHTTHLTVTDREGNIVAYTFTIEDWGGSGIVVPGYGFLLNNELTDFNFSQPRANLPAARKRPRSSMTPTLVMKDGKPVLSLGSPGGSTIITTVLQTLVNFFDMKMSLADALAAPRMSEQNKGSTQIEPTYSQTAASKALLKMGHQWAKVPKEIGAANAIFFNDDGSVIAISEPMRHGVGAALVQSKIPLAVVDAKK